MAGQSSIDKVKRIDCRSASLARKVRRVRASEY